MHYSSKGSDALECMHAHDLHHPAKGTAQMSDNGEKNRAHSTLPRDSKSKGFHNKLSPYMVSMEETTRSAHCSESARGSTREHVGEPLRIFACNKMQPCNQLPETATISAAVQLAEVVLTLLIWRHFLHGMFFLLLTVHKSTSSNRRNRQRKWLEFLVDYDIDIVRHPGKANVVVDALSKKPLGCEARLSSIGI